MRAGALAAAMLGASSVACPAEDLHLACTLSFHREVPDDDGERARRNRDAMAKVDSLDLSTERRIMLIGRAEGRSRVPVVAFGWNGKDCPEFAMRADARAISATNLCGAPVAARFQRDTGALRLVTVADPGFLLTEWVCR